MPDSTQVSSCTPQCVVTKNALDVIFFHPCETVEDFYRPRLQFSPLFCHHFFGEAEQLTGDENLKIRIFYTPDTFEAFLKVEGRPVLLVEENKVESSMVNGGNTTLSRTNASVVAASNGNMVGSKRTVLDCLLEKTPFPGGFCNTQNEFIQKIRNRKQVFIPPGEIVAECMLGKEFFQIRECIFTDKHDVSSTTNPNTSTIGGVSSFSSISTSSTFSAASSVSDAFFYSSTSLSSSSGNATVYPYKFDSLHRRIEWFLHWFIESASPIDHDSRWRILLPYIVKGKHHISHPWVSHSTFMAYVQRKFNEYYELHEEKKRKINNDFISTKESEKKGIKTILNGDPGKEEDPKLVGENNNNLLNHAPTLGLVQSRSKRLRKAGGREDEENDYSWHLAGMASTYTFFTINKDRRRISQFMIFPHMQSKGMGMKLLEYIYIQAMLDDNVAEITVEDPAASFSQLRDVVSLKLCFDSSFLSKYCLYPSNVRKKIENKKNENISFFDKNLSYIKSHLESSHSYINKEKNENGKKLEKYGKNEKENLKQNNAEEKSVLCYLPDKRLIIAVTKETSRQATRILETLGLANVMPHPMPMPPTLLFTPLQIKSEIPRDWRIANIKIDYVNNSMFNNNVFNNSNTFNNLLMDDNNYYNKVVDDLFCDSNACKELRVSVKKRMRKEHMEELSEISATGIRAELDYRWKEHYAALYRTIRKLRLIFPL